LYYEGDNVTLGYAETRADLQKGDERHGRLFTGDIAYKDEDGYFYIVGRKKRFIKLTGKRFNLDEAEQLLKNSLTTGEVACTGKDEQLQIYTTASQELPALEAILQHTLQLLPRQYVLQVVNTIPKNSSGKIQYTRLTQPEAAL
ncbi:MAG: AMP-binding protein, partial [Megasphaera lornae]